MAVLRLSRRADLIALQFGCRVSRFFLSAVRHLRLSQFLLPLAVTSSYTHQISAQSISTYLSYDIERLVSLWHSG